jgi:hypothetical protein
MILGYVPPPQTTFEEGRKKDYKRKEKRMQEQDVSLDMLNMQRSSSLSGFMPPPAPSMSFAAPPPPPMQVASSKAEQGSLSSTYHIDRVSTIPSDNEPHKVTIAVITLKDCKQQYCTVPVLDTNAYLKVKSVNNSDFILFPGGKCHIVV